MTLPQIYETRPDGMEWLAYNEKHRLYHHPQQETFGFLYRPGPNEKYGPDNHWEMDKDERNHDGWEWQEVRPEIREMDSERITSKGHFYINCWILCRDVYLEIFPDGHMDFREELHETHYTPKEKAQILEIVKEHYRKEKEKAEQRINDCVKFISFL
jgi:hypothetical protein